MNNRLFVAGLPWAYGDEELKGLFATYGTITYARVSLHRDTGKSRGFGFVEFKDAHDAEVAMHEMNGKEVDKRKIVVNVARPREDR